MRLTSGQRTTLTRFLTNAGTIVLGGLVLGPFIGQRQFQLKVFAVGSILYAALLWTALWLSPDGDEKERT